jgi:hypothetical protein
MEETTGRETAAAETVEPIAAPEEIPAPAEGTTTSEYAKRLTATQWAEIEAHWEYGTMKAVDICKNYGVSGSALSGHFKRHKILRNSKAHLIKKAAAEKIVGAAAIEVPLAVEFENKRKARIAQTREHNYSLSQAVASRATKIAKEIIDGTRNEAACAADLKALRHFEMLIEKNTSNRLRILNADAEVDEAKMPTLTFRDLTEEEIQSKAEADDDDDDLGLTLPEDGDEEIVEEGVPSLPSS